MYRVVIVGGGFGGLEAAKALRSAEVSVTLIDRTNHHVFQPLLYQVATAGLSPADICAPIRRVLRGARHTEILMAEVVGVDTEARKVLLEDRAISYDFLILATGARHSYFGKDAWETFAPGLKTITDATAIRRSVLTAFEAAEMETDPEKRRAYLTFILVGGGPTGVEMAGAIAELAKRALAKDFHHIDPREARILLLEAGPRILTAFPDDLAERAKQALEQMGAEVRTGSAVESVDAEGVLVGGERIASRTVLWAAGVFASPAGKWIGAETDRAGRVLVAPDLSVPGHPNIFVIGDAAHVQRSETELVPGVAPAAMQEGRYAAQVICHRLTGKEPPPPFVYVDKGNLATVGRKFAIADFGRFRLAGFLAWLFWLGLHIFFLIGFRNRLLVLIQWAWAYFTFERGARLIIQERAEEIGSAHRDREKIRQD